MSCNVFILHSASTTYSSSVLSQAASCSAAIFSSTRVCSPDFIPTVALLRANPVEGVHYAYTSSASDGCFEAGRHMADQTLTGKRSVASKCGMPSSFSGRSVIGLQRAILRCREGCVAAEKPSDPWRCLAGALLAACSYIRAHTCMRDDQGQDGSTTFENQVPAACLVAIFSDVNDARPISFATDCSLSAAAMAATKLGITTHVFGPFLVSSPGGSRLQALAHSTGGLYAPCFALSLVGRLLQGYAKAEVVEGERGYAAWRQARERLVQHYVVQPTNLPQDPAMASLRAESDVSCLAWLCPNCMAVVVRQPREETETVKTCPYCPSTD
ncbi:hypothetical protein TRVL_03984 [Trypanosoma vivax]|nr:hypothetical protein TRVL_03984 [Trypanosoma vivax]